jgi:hypothetical protein
MFKREEIENKREVCIFCSKTGLAEAILKAAKGSSASSNGSKETRQ